MEAIEALDPEHLCTDYWAGKHEREAAAAGLPVPSRAGGGRPAAGPSRRRGGKRTRCVLNLHPLLLLAVLGHCEASKVSRRSWRKADMLN